MTCLEEKAEKHVKAGYRYVMAQRSDKTEERLGLYSCTVAPILVEATMLCPHSGDKQERIPRVDEGTNNCPLRP